MMTNHSIHFGLILLATIACAGRGLAQEPTNKHEWPFYRGDAGFSGVSPDASVKPPFKLLWSHRLDGDASGDAGAGVIVAGGKVFVNVDNTKSLVALRADTGAMLWEYFDPHMGYLTVPSYHAGRLFVWKRVGERSIVQALDANTGKPLWNQPLKSKGRPPSRVGLPIQDGKIFCVEGDGEPAVVALDPATGKILWRSGLGTDDGLLTMAPSASNGVVYVATRKTPSFTTGDVGASIALSAADGKILWRRKGVFPARSLANDGSVVVCPMNWSTDKQLYLLDAKSGKTLWSAKQLGFYFPATLTKDLVLVKPYGSSITALDRKTGKEQWKFSAVARSGCCTPVVAGDYAYMGTGIPPPTGDLEALDAFQLVNAPREKGSGGTMFAVNLKTGKSDWHFATGNCICGDPAIAYGRLYFHSRDGRVYCFTPCKEGEPMVPGAKDKSAPMPIEKVRALLATTPMENPDGKSWPMWGSGPERAGQQEITLKAPLELAWKFPLGGPIHTSAALRDGKVYAASDAGKIVAIDATTGKHVWEFDTSAQIRCSPAAVNGLVYCGSDRGVFHALDAETGKEKWRFEAGGPVQASPVVTRGVAIFAANDHHVYALDAKTGQKLWSFRSNYYAMQAAPVVQGDQVFIAQWADWVHALDLATGQSQWRSFVPVAIESLAFYQGKLYVRSPYYVVELDPPTGKRLRIGTASYGFNGVAFMKDHLFQTGIRGQYGSFGATALDLSEPGAEINRKIPTLEGVKLIPSKSLKSFPLYAAMGSPLVLGNNICFAARDGRIFLTEPDGKQVWTFKMDGPCHATPTAAAGLLVVGCDDGTLYAFRPRKQ